MKILVVLTGGIRADGITTVWLTYCREMQRQGLDGKYTIDFGVIDGLSEEPKVRELETLGLGVVRLPDRMRNPLAYVSRLVGVLRKGGYDAIHANGSSSLLAIEMLAGRCAGTYLRIAHSHNTECSHRLMHKVLHPLFMSLCNGRLACGEDAGKWLFHGRDFAIINNGKDFSKFHYSATVRDAVRRSTGLSGRFVIGHVGWFTKIKNQTFLVDVFAEFVRIVPDAVLYMMGTGDMMEEVRAKASALGLGDRVVLAGLVSDMPDRLQAMDMMVLPSLHEGLPNVVLEWQALGLPCLLADTVTKACAVSDLVEFKSLDCSPKDWALQLKAMHDKKRYRCADAEKGIYALRRNGFDIADDARFLCEQYERLMKSVR